MISKRKNISIFFICVALVFTLVSCVKYQYLSPYAKYDHEQHENIIVKNDMNCYTCHKLDIDEKDPIKKLELLKAKLKESREKYFEKTTCHKCHNIEDKDNIRAKEMSSTNGVMKNGSAPANCKLCHEYNMKQILPKDHGKGWTETHGSDSRSSTDSCYNCHQKWYCVDCHTASDLSVKRPHNRMFRLAHVSAAMVDPASCDSCHKASFCIDCHSTRGRR